jgi:hypothetical protein
VIWSPLLYNTFAAKLSGGESSGVVVSSEVKGKGVAREYVTQYPLAVRYAAEMCDFKDFRFDRLEQAARYQAERE